MTYTVEVEKVLGKIADLERRVKEMESLIEEKVLRSCVSCGDLYPDNELYRGKCAYCLSNGY